jgi:aconitate decarboxylase
MDSALTREQQLLAYIQGARFDALDSAAVGAASIFTLDSLGVGLAGSRVALSTSLRTVLADSWGSATTSTGARVWGSGERLPAPQAAMVNAYQIHNQEFDCVHEAAVVHPMAVILACLLASSERIGGCSGRNFVTALAVAVDVATILGMSASQPMRFFRPGMCGAFGAVAGVALIEGLSPEQTHNALGIVYSHLGGTMQAHVEGSAMLPLQVALNARNALAAVDLARAGFDGPRQFLDGQFGFFSLMEDAGNADRAFALLGRESQLPHISHKPFPTGRAAHGGLDGVISLQRQHGFSVHDIASIQVAAPPLVRRLVDRPALAEMGHNYAKLCLGYVIACQLLEGEVSLDAYSACSIADVDKLELASRVSMIANDVDDPNALAPQTVTVNLRSGARHTVHLPAVLGHPQRPLERSQYLQKFRNCCLAAQPPLLGDTHEKIIVACDALARLDDVRELVDLVSAHSSQ